MKWFFWVLAAVFGAPVLVLVALYVAWPVVLDAVLPRLAARYGVDAIAVTAPRPTFSGLRIERAALRSRSVAVTVDDAVVDWDLESLLAMRMRGVEVRTLSIDIAASDEPPLLTIPPLWNLIPAERLVIEALSATVAEPQAEVVGRFDLDADRAQIEVTVASPLLPAALALEASLHRDGRIDVSLAPPGGVPVVTLQGTPEGDSLAIAGRVTLEAEPFDLLARLAGLAQARGRLEASLTGRTPWPLPSTIALSDLTADAAVTLAFEGTQPRFGRFAVAGALDLRVGEGRLEAVLRPGAHVSLPESSIAGATGSGAVLETLEEISLRADARAPGLTLDAPALVLTPPALRAGQRAVTFGSEDRIRAALTALAPWPLGEAPLDGVVATLRAEFALAPTLAGVAFAEWSELEGTVSGRWAAGRFDGEIASGGSLTVGGLLAAPDVSAPEVGLELLSAIPLAFDAAMGTAQLGKAEIGWAAPEVRAAGQRLAFRGGRLDLDSLEWREDRLAIAARLKTHAGRDALPLAIVGELTPGTGHGRIRLTSEGAVSRGLLRTELGGWRGAADLDSGVVAFHFEGDFRLDPEAAIRGVGRLAVSQGGVRVGELSATGLALDLPLRFAVDGITVGPGPVAVEHADVGVPVAGAAATVTAVPTAVTLEDASAHLLGGRIAVDRLDYDLRGGAAEFVVRLDGLSLTEVLSLEGEHIEGTGILDGTLPVALASGTLTMTGGQVAARSPGGRIRYRGTASAAARKTPGLGLALDALADFEYHRLDADADYDADGTLTLAVRLQGRNPAVEKGRPIHFNLTVTENIPTLLRALRAGEAVTERVQERFSR